MNITLKMNYIIKKIVSAYIDNNELKNEQNIMVYKLTENEIMNSNIILSKMLRELSI